VFIDQVGVVLPVGGEVVLDLLAGLDGLGGCVPPSTPSERRTG
jgi:hypothetical protein